MKILLLYPEFPDTFWSFKHALKFIDKKAGTPPLGLLTIAAMLPHGWEKRLVDVNIRSLQDSDLDWADWVMISGMVVQRDSAFELIQRAKDAGKKVIAGG
ncbi:MAG: cobalamin B12-binding domain-containing protein, partial [Anaerolineaceae bacterium]|nr:cobalamin B12-binding domain-containing protein [Anaerolineaceae bacterium]